MADMTNLDCEDECDGVLFDETGLEQKWGTYSRRNQKMLLDELANVETEQSFREQTENDMMQTDRDLVPSKSVPMRERMKKSNSLTKSQGLPGSNNSDKQSQGSTIGLGAIKLDFRKNSSGGGGLMKMLKGGGGSNNKIEAEVRSSQEAILEAAKNSSGSGKRTPLYSAIEMTQKASYQQVAPQTKY